MGIGATELTLDQLAAYKYSNVNFVNVPGGDLLYTVVGHPNTVIINLGELLNIASGEVQGDAIAIDELEASQIADGAITGSELAETPSLFHTPTATVIHDHNDDAAGAELLAANAAGEGDRLVLVQCTVTEAFVTTSWGINVGSASAAGGLFTDIFDGVAALAIDETVVGAYLLPEAEALVTAEVDMTGDTAGILSFAVIVLTPAAGSIPGALLANDAVGLFSDATPVAVDHGAGGPVELLALDAVNTRLCLIMGIATESAAGAPEVDVGSELTATDAAFNDISGGTWVLGERWVGACMLPAGESLDATINAAGTAGAISFYVIPLTVVAGGAAGLSDLFVGGTEIEQDHTTGAGNLLAANAAGGGDRLLVVQAEVTEAWAGTSWEIDVGSAASSDGLFNDIFAGAVPLAVGASVIGSYLLPEGEALALVETDMTAITAGKIMFRILVNTPAAGSIPGNILDNDAVNFPDEITPTNVAFDGGGTQVLLALDATQDRIVLVTAIVTVSAEAGVCDWDVGGVGGNEVFNDLNAGAWVAGDRYVGSMLLLQDEALNCTLQVAGAAGAIDFYVQEIGIGVRTASIYDDAITDAKIASSIIKDEGVQAHACMRVVGVAVDADAVVIGTDTYTVDDIGTDSNDDTEGGLWNNVNNPLTVAMAAAEYPVIGVAGTTPLVVNEVIYIGTEYLRVTAIDGNNVTFRREVCNSAVAVHADAVDIYVSAGTPAAANVYPVGNQGGGDLAAAIMTPLIAEVINEVDAQGLLADDLYGDGSVLLVVADAVGVVALGTTETHSNGVWDAANMRRGVAAAVRQQANIVIEPDAEEVALGDMIVPLPFAPTVVHILVITTATGATVAWDGVVEIVAAAGIMPDYIILDNSNAVDWAEASTIYITATS